MVTCSLRLGPRHAYERTEHGAAVPVVRVAIHARPLPRAVVAPFTVDTGCDVPFVLAPRLRDRLKVAGCVSSIDQIDWGGRVVCERYELRAFLGGRWTAFDAYYPLGPTSDQNLVGLPFFAGTTLCLRAPLGEIYTAGI